MSGQKLTPEQLKAASLADMERINQRNTAGLRDNLQKIRQLMGDRSRSVNESIIMHDGELNSMFGHSNMGQQQFHEITGHTPPAHGGYVTEDIARRYNTFGSAVVLPNANFQVSEVLKETANGKTLTRYRVRARNGDKLGPDFTREEDAKLLAAFLNETGRLDDPRAKHLIDLVNRETQITSSIRKASAKYQVAEGKQRQLLEGEIRGLKRDLADVRNKLDV